MTDWSGNGNVVSMNRFRSGKTLSLLHQAEAYWSALRRDGDVPLRSQIDPRGLERVLPHAFILQRIAPGLARVRVAGHCVNDLAGMEARGLPFSTLFAAHSRAGLADVLHHLFDTPSVARLTLNTKGNGDAVEARMLLLPLKCDMGDVSRALGVVLADPDQSDTPRRFELLRRDLRPVSGRPGAAQRGDMVAGFAEPQAALDGRGRFLRLIRPDAD